MLEEIATGATNREIGERLYLSPHTVKEHTSSIYRKLEVRNRAEAVQHAQRLGPDRLSQRRRHSRFGARSPRPSAAIPPVGGLRPGRLNFRRRGGEVSVDANRAPLPRPGQPDRTACATLVERHEPELARAGARPRSATDPFALAGEGTAYAQPAILCASLAAWTRAGRPQAAVPRRPLARRAERARRRRRDRRPTTRCGSRSLRGRLMQEAAGDDARRDAGPARRRATRPVPPPRATGVVVANDNGPTQLVVAGPARGARRDRGGGEGARRAGDPARRPRRLPHAGDGARRGAVSGGARRGRDRAARGAGLLEHHARSRSATAPTGSATSSRRRSCARCAGARRSRSCTALGVRSFVETGPGKALTGMVRRAFDDVEASVLGEREAGPCLSSPPLPQPIAPDRRPAPPRGAAIGARRRRRAATVRRQRPDRRAARASSEELDRRPHRRPRAPRRRRRRAAGRLRGRGGAPRARRRRRSTPAEVDLVLVATMSHEQLTPTAAPLVADADRRRAARGRSTSAPPARASSPRSRSPPARSRPGARATVLVVGADLMSRLTDPRRSRHRGAVRRRRRRGRRQRRAERAGRSARRARRRRRPRRPDHGRARGGHRADEGPRHLPPRGRPARARRRSPPPRRPARALDEIDVFAYHQANGRILAAVGERLGLDPRAGDRLHRPLRQHLGGDDPARARRRPRGGPPAAGRPVLLAAFGGGLTWAATVVEWGAGATGGGADGAEGCALVTGSARGIGAADRDGARRRGLAGGRSTTAPTPRAREALVARIERRRRTRDRASPPTSPSPDRSRRCSSAPRQSSARCWCWSTTPACAPTGSRRSSVPTHWDAVLDTNLSAAFHTTRRALRPMLRARFGRIVNVASIVGPRANAGPGQLRGLEGGPDRAHEDGRGRGRAPRRSPSTRSPRAWSRPSSPRGSATGSPTRSPRAAGHPGGGRRLRALPRLRRGRLRDRLGADRRRRPERLSPRPTNDKRGEPDANPSHQRGGREGDLRRPRGDRRRGRDQPRGDVRGASTSTRSTWSSWRRSSRTSSGSSSTATRSRT